MPSSPDKSLASTVVTAAALAAFTFADAVATGFATLTTVLTATLRGSSAGSGCLVALSLLLGHTDVHYRIVDVDHAELVVLLHKHGIVEKLHAEF